jgi:hypothetical protein
MMHAAGIVRILIAWAAILAYGAPGAVHGLQRGHAHAATTAHAGDEHGDHAHGGAIATQTSTDAADAGDGSHSHGTPWCCVAMCIPALPASVPVTLIPAHYAALAEASRVQTPKPGDRSPLERPPKS